MIYAPSPTAALERAGDEVEEWTHFDENGSARMVDVGQKEITDRVAAACGRIYVNEKVYQAIRQKTAKKGDVLFAARIAGIMGAKKTSELIPLCHSIALTGCTVEFLPDDGERAVEVICTVKTSGKTGVEMEAMTGACTALLTIYDMCKAMDRSMTITGVSLLKKDGGKSGLYVKAGMEP